MVGKMSKKSKEEREEKVVVTRESTESMTEGATERESYEKLAEELARTKEEAAENYDKYLRTSAELENYKKRAIKERADAINYGNEKILKDILPIIDSMERALDHSSNSQDFDAFVEGLNLIYEQLCSVLQKHGVERIDAVGQEFDPNFHEAMLQVESEDYENNTVVEEFEKGYVLNGRLLRPAKAAVSKHIEKETQE
jgi:molecular chaperone GrpE